MQQLPSNRKHPEQLTSQLSRHAHVHVCFPCRTSSYLQSAFLRDTVVAYRCFPKQVKKLLSISKFAKRFCATRDFFLMHENTLTLDYPGPNCERQCQRKKKKSKFSTFFNGSSDGRRQLWQPEPCLLLLHEMKPYGGGPVDSLRQK